MKASTGSVCRYFRLSDSIRSIRPSGDKRRAPPSSRYILNPKAFALLQYLIENSGRLVSHEELLDVLWPNVHVQPEVIKSHILAIRTAWAIRRGSRGTSRRFASEATASSPV